MDVNIAQRGTRRACSGDTWVKEDIKGPQEASVGDQMGHQGKPDGPSGENRWALRPPKSLQKGAKLEPLENTKIELSLQRELHLATLRTFKREPQNRAAIHGHRNEVAEVQQGGQNEA